MSSNRINPSGGAEVRFAEDEIIVSKTDLRGILTYANDVFIRVGGYSEEELLGKPHNIIRHPDMPKCIFKLLWETLKSKNEIFAYVMNMTKDGGFYWVFAHVTPSFDLQGQNVGFHSSRRVPAPDGLSKIKPIYAELLAIERRSPNPKAGMEDSYQALMNMIRKEHADYSEFVFSLSESTQLNASIR